MKHIKQIKKIAGLALVLITMLSTSCKDFLDINTDPNFADKAQLNQLLPAAQANYALGLSSMLERCAATMVNHYINGRFDNYGFDGNSYDNDWTFQIYSGGLIDLQAIIDQGTASGDFHYVGLAKLQMAFVYSNLVDLFGDVPFSDALRGVDGNFNATLDNGASVYQDILALIDEGITDLGQTSNLSPGRDDLIYGGDLTAWEKMGNTLKLKMYLQMRLVDNSVSSEINTLISSGNLISSPSENFTFAYSNSNTPENRHPNFQSDYAAAGVEHQMGTYFYGILLANNDPRIPFYYFNQTAGTFIGRVPGQASSPGDDLTRTNFGIYPFGGKYDDGSGGTTTGNSGSGSGLSQFITYTQTLFMQAESALTLGTTGDSRALLEAALNSAFDDVSAFSLANNGPAVDAIDAASYIAASLATYDAAADNSARLGVLMTEKYVAMFGNGIVSYSDFRRTGFPTGIPAPVVQSGPFPLRLPIPPTEVQSNSNVETGGDVTSPVFWDN